MSEIKVRDYSFDLLRFPLAIVILFVHVFSVTELPTSVGISHTQLLPGVQSFINAFVRGHSVPIFFFISGFVFFYGKNLTYSYYLKKLKTRLSSLLVPYIIWNLIALLMVISVAVYFKGGGLSVNVENILSCFWVYDGSIVDSFNKLGLPVNGPTWFVRDLMIVVLFTPLLNVLLKARRGFFTIFLLLTLYFLNSFGINVFLPITSLLFFSFGAFVSLNQYIEKIRKLRFKPIFIYLLLGVTYLLFHNDIPANYLDLLKAVKIFIGVVAAYNLSYWLLEKKYCRVNPFFSSASFFLYMSHGIIYGPVLRSLFYIIRPETRCCIFIVYILAGIIIITMLLFLYYVIKRYIPFFSLILTGGR